MKKIKFENSVIIDTETTGLDYDAEICQIGVIDAMTGEVLFNSLIKPSKPIPLEASKIHRIYDKDVIDAPNFIDIADELLSILNNKTLLAYNKYFDERLLIQTADIVNCSYEIKKKFERLSYGECIMHWYAEYFNDWDDYHQDYKWQRLTCAARQQQIDISDLLAHQAISDCEITRRVIHAVNKKIECEFPTS